MYNESLRCQLKVTLCIHKAVWVPKKGQNKKIWSFLSLKPFKSDSSMNVQYEDVASASLQMQCCRVKRPESLGIHHADGFAHGEAKLRRPIGG